jgi:hypothetical protein
MAVYKASECYPFQTSVDPKVVTEDGIVWLKCQINTSNAKATGYSVRVYDSDGNVVFANDGSDSGAQATVAAKGGDCVISPISELPTDPDDPMANTGYNGTQLEIPFIQNRYIGSALKTISFNSIYCAEKYSVDFYTTEPLSTPELIANIDGIPTSVGQTVLSPAVGTSDYQIRKITVDADTGELALTVLSKQPEIGDIIGVKNGISYGGLFFTMNTTGAVRVASGIWNVILPSFGSNGSVSSAFADSGAHLTADDFTNAAGSYRWEVTIYQGSTGVTSEASAGTGAMISDYSALAAKEKDLVLTTGTVLGSCSTRIQIDPTTEVIQTRFVQLATGADPSTAQGVRGSIETYDDTYGHIYPMDTWGVANYVNQSNIRYCFVYKHSNNESEIGDASDIVDCATTADIGESFCLAAGDPSIASIDGYTLSDGSRVLVKNQAKAYLNGVYIVSTTSQWVRSGAYDTWGEFIGKIIFVRYGSTNGSRNFICQAYVGGELAVYNSSSKIMTPTTSPLFFNEEVPMVLYPSKLTYSPTMMFVGAHSAVSSTATLVDGYPVASGDTVLFVGDGVYTASVTGAAISWSPTLDASGASVYSASGVYFIVRGQLFGNKAYTNVGSLSAYAQSWLPYAAPIHKNTATLTYISPFLGLRPGMTLLLDAPNKAYIGGVAFSDIQILGVDTVNWSITHAVLTQPLSAESAWKYSIRSFSQASDLNPFLTYDAPLVTLSQTPAPSVSRTLCVTDLHLSDSEAPLSGYLAYLTPTDLARHSLAVSGSYYQNQAISWIWHEWILMDSVGSVLQRTGRVYGGDMSTVFYGLAWDGADTHYVVALVLCDALDNISAALAEVNCVEDTDTNSEYAFPFTAVFDSASQSVALAYKDIAMEKPYVSVGSSDIELSANAAASLNVGYIADSGALTDQSLWNGTTMGYSYANATDSYMALGMEMNADSGAASEPNAPIYVSNRSIALAAQVFNGATQLPMPSILTGASYGTVFQDGEHSVKAGAQLTPTDSNGAFVVQTAHRLGDDFVGDIAAVVCGANTAPQVVNATYSIAESADSYVTVRFYCPVCVDSNGVPTADRGTVSYDISVADALTGESTDALSGNLIDSSTGAEIVRFNTASYESNGILNYLQTDGSVALNHEFLHLKDTSYKLPNGAASSANASYWALNSGGRLYNSNQPICDACLGPNTASANSVSYWIESNAHAYGAEIPHGNASAAAGSNQNFALSDGSQAAWGENGQYWIEPSAQLSLTPLAPYKRHSGLMMNSDTYMVRLTVLDADALATAAKSYTAAAPTLFAQPITATNTPASLGIYTDAAHKTEAAEILLVHPYSGYSDYFPTVKKGAVKNVKFGE